MKRRRHSRQLHSSILEWCLGSPLCFHHLICIFSHGRMSVLDVLELICDVDALCVAV